MMGIAIVAKAGIELVARKPLRAVFRDFQ